MSSKLFGTDGIRGIANREVTPEIAFSLGEAVVRFLADRGPGAGAGAPRFVVGRDTRLSGQMLEAALTAGITSAGGEVLTCGVIPTPAVAHLTRELAADGGIVISASHNPPQFNGLKVFTREGFKLPDELEEAIEEYLTTGKPDVASRPIGAQVGTVQVVEDALDRYIAFALATIGETSLAGLKVALDCGHGAAFESTPRAFAAAGAEVVAVNTDFDGTDINVGCGSTNLSVVSELVASGGFALGIAHDGDADRVLAVDECGAEVDGDQIMAVLANYMHARGELTGDTVVSTVMCNLGFEVAMRELGVNLVKTGVGDRFVLEQMRAMGANLGGEQSGHIIMLDHNSTGDGLVTALALAAVVAESGKPLSELVAVMTRYPQVLIGVHTSHKERLATSAAVSAAIHEEEAALGETGRVLVRASGTEPLIRVMVEAADAATAQDVAARLAAIVEQELGD